MESGTPPSERLTSKPPEPVGGGKPAEPAVEALDAAALLVDGDDQAAGDRRRLQGCDRVGDPFVGLPDDDHAADQAAVEPIYESMEGWQESTAGARSYADLPANAVKYIQRVQELIETPVALVSTSPERDDTILMRDPFMD